MKEEMNGTDVTEGAKDSFEDMPEWGREVARKYGRSMFALVLNAGMAQQATAALNEVINKHQSRHGQRALAIIADAFNQVSNAYVLQMGWDAETLAQCDRDCQLAYSKSIQLAPAGILLAN